MHGPQLAIGGSLERTSRVFCPKEYGEANLPTFPFMMVDMRQVLSFRSTPRRARRPPDRYADSLGMDAPGGNRGKSRGPRKTPSRAKRQRSDKGVEGGRTAGGTTEEVATGLDHEEGEVKNLGCTPPPREGAG